MHIAYKQYALRVVILPSYRDKWQQLSLVMMGAGHWLHASRLCADAGLASCIVEIMRDTDPNATRPAD
jgi:hypothetical protein